MNHLEKEVAPLSTFESKLIKENQNLLKKLDQQIKQLTEQVEILTKSFVNPQPRKLKLIQINSHFLRILF